MAGTKTGMMIQTTIKTALVLLVAVLLSCTPRLQTHRFVPHALQAPAAQARIVAPPSGCAGWEGYLPDLQHPDHLPERYLRVNFHVMDNSAGTAHRPKDSVLVFVRQLLEYANAELDTNAFHWRAPEGTPVLPKRYRYVLTPQPDDPEDDGIYFHYDDDLYYFVSVGRNQNNYNQDVIRKYGIGTDSIVNIFLMVHHPDSMRSGTYRANGQGIALGTALKMAGVLESREGPRSFDGLLNHEVGHILGLAHSWGEDGCPDTNKHPNKCWDWTPEPPCRDNATNNMMDYNAYQLSLTPCQIGKIQATFARERNRVRACLEPTWCTLRADRAIVIRDSVRWTGDRDLEGNLTVARGGVLQLTCRVSMPPGSHITVEPGGVLILDGCRLHNACSKTWEGVLVQEMAGEQGRVEVRRAPVIENLTPG
ncbi:MAG: hypothetical protein EP344_15635 [Bacteroidetes bacterium]|nr:MAG: hypothetical protein EP344_15635 [Bacteroidota bacterium]